MVFRSIIFQGVVVQFVVARHLSNVSQIQKALIWNFAPSWCQRPHPCQHSCKSKCRHLGNASFLFSWCGWKLKLINHHVKHICSLGSQRLWTHLFSNLFQNDTHFCSKNSFNGTEERRRFLAGFPFPLILFDRNENFLCHSKPRSNVQANLTSSNKANCLYCEKSQEEVFRGFMFL